MTYGQELIDVGRSLPPQRTPRRSSSANSQTINPTASQPGARSVSTPQAPYSYSNILAQGVEEWTQAQAEEDEEDEDEEEEEDEDEIIYDDEEDEFGLPSIASMRRKRDKNTGDIRPRSIDPGGGSIKDTSTNLAPPPSATSNRQRANSSDIAEERGPPMYPPTRKGEGKILRPQYRDILIG